MKEQMLIEAEKWLQELEQWCLEHRHRLEIVVNDWGLAKLTAQKATCLTLSLGTLLNKYKKDPRMQYKQGNKGLLRENNLCLKDYREYLTSEYGISRYEWESCGYERLYPEGKNSLHFPFYQTNTSQYCTLYASCTTGQRGRQKWPINCPQYCKEFVFLYPDHLKMIGKYNSLFAFDDTLLREPSHIETLVNAGVDRFVVNLL